MKRQRPFRPRIPRPGSRFRTPVPIRHVPPLLIKANHLYEEGEYGEAARLYEDLAIKSACREMLPAPHLFIRAGRKNLLCGNMGNAIRMFLRGFGIFADQGRWNELHWMSDRVIDDLRQQGQHNSADELMNWIKQALLESETEFQENSTTIERITRKKTVLPLKCPSCGGSIHPDEVIWVDENLAECSYCRNLFRGGPA